MVSHVISLLAALPFNSNTKREKHKQIREKKLFGQCVSALGGTALVGKKESSDTDQNGGS